MKSTIFFGLIMISWGVHSQKPIFVSAKTKAATVYFNGAELTQTAGVSLPLGVSEIVIKNVANSLNESTIQIGAPSTVTVLSVQFTNNYVSDFEVDQGNLMQKRVRDSITYIQKEIKKIKIKINSIAQTIVLLDANKVVGGTNSGLNVTELIKLVDYYKNKRTELENNSADLQEKEQILIKKLQGLNDQLELSSSSLEKTSAGKLILQVYSNLAATVPFTISYITNTATWAPFYDLRADAISLPINLIYKAQISQNSGVDWKKVILTLSSGLPNQGTIATTLTPWFLNYSNVYKKLQGKVMGIAIDSDQAMERKSKISSEIAAYPTTQIIENQLNISFDIEIPYDIASNGKIHSVTLKELKIPATYNYFAAPRIEKEAFLIAEINNYSRYNLLQGEANIIFEGMFVGKTIIDPNQISDTLQVNMGRDKRISIKRDKIIDKSGTKFLSSYKEQTFTYEITIRNNKSQAIELLLKDQYPLSSNKEITIDLLESDGAKINAETAILSWNIKLGAAETKKVRLGYKIKYPKDQIIDNL